jgi:hypothetical protein
MKVIFIIKVERLNGNNEISNNNSVPTRKQVSSNEI